MGPGKLEWINTIKVQPMVIDEKQALSIFSALPKKIEGENSIFGFWGVLSIFGGICFGGVNEHLGELEHCPVWGQIQQKIFDKAPLR